MVILRKSNRKKLGGVRANVCAQKRKIPTRRNNKQTTMKEREKQMDQEMTYTVIGPDGQMDYIWADTMFEAYQQGLEQYGNGTMVRPSFYKEWNCGMYKEGDRCGHDKYGNHITAKEAVLG